MKPDFLYMIDVFTLLNTAVAAPRAFGFSNVTEPCLTIDDDTTIGMSFEDLFV